MTWKKEHKAITTKEDIDEKVLKDGYQIQNIVSSMCGKETVRKQIPKTI